MTPSRRDVLGALAVAAVALSAGCTTEPVGGDGTTDEPGGELAGTDGSPTSGSEQVFVVRLSGPDTDRLLFDGSDVESVGTVRAGGGGVYLPVVLTDDATADVTEVVRTTGAAEQPEQFEFVHEYDGEVVGRFVLSPGLAEEMASGEWDGEFVQTFERRERAEEVRRTLADGSG